MEIEQQLLGSTAPQLHAGATKDVRPQVSSPSVGHVHAAVSSPASKLPCGLDKASEREALGFGDMTQLLPRDVSMSSDQVLIVLGFEEVRLELPGVSCRQTPWGLCIQCPVLPLVGLASWLPRSQGAWNCSGLKVRFEK